MTVFFHGNFGMNRERMSCVLKAGLENPTYRDAELAKPFGYGAPFASAYRSWLHKSGVIELRLPITLTNFGEVLCLRDPDFFKAPTLWYLNQQLTTDPVRAEAWHFFMGEFRSLHPRFSVTDLRNALVMKLSAHDAKHFGPKSKMIPVIARKLLECYTAEAGLGDLKLLRSASGETYEFSNGSEIIAFATPTELADAY